MYCAAINNRNAAASAPIVSQACTRIHAQSEPNSRYSPISRIMMVSPGRIAATHSIGRATWRDNITTLLVSLRHDFRPAEGEHRIMAQQASPSVRAVVLCGGTGSRLWPLSTQQYPKQFVELFGQQSLFENT